MGRRFSSAAVGLSVLCLLGLVTASGAATGALWGRSVVAEGGGIILGDLDLVEGKAAPCGLTWEVTRQSGPPLTGTLAQDLITSYRVEPGDELVITQCLKLTIEGDNEAVKIAAEVENFSSPYFDLDSSSIQVEPVDSGVSGHPGPQSWQHRDPPTMLTSGSATDEGYEGATNQSATPSTNLAPGSAPARSPQWNVVLTVTVDKDWEPPEGNPDDPDPPTLDPPMKVPEIAVSADQVRSGVWF
jgi:alternate signal-mediated exported protein